eukprot:TRINITY_DN1488_c0_g6_i1.p1 TRINITY_DN1488_c0_g6~~TRINITY_DN1488_c0_g6_i1.p1  ORF type:complete len:3347 (+),score=823.83 TRINITY_DN1488_c0_g6_i1:868-10041(+)
MPKCNPLTGLCESHAKRDNTACDDANPLTQLEYCSGGYCRGMLQCGGSTCVAPEGCKTVICSGTTCEYIAVADGTPCFDGNAATPMDVCMGGVCVGYDLCAGKTCNAASQCHLPGECLPNGECTQPLRPNESPCDDRDPDTFPDVCRQGECVGLSRCDGVVCEPSDQCHYVGACSPVDGLCTDTPKPEGTPCDDARGDTLDDVCLPHVGCSGSVQCLADDCVPSSPCHYPICNNSVCGELPKPNGVSCNDNNNQTVGDRCVYGKCVGQSACEGVVCVAISECRNPGVCDQALGGCTSPSKPDGVVCNGGGGTCQDGVCITAERCDGVVCEASDQCHNVGMCDPATGLCTDPVKSDGLLCDDGNPNSDAVCQGGMCVSSVPCGQTVCTSTNPCASVRCSGDTCTTLTKPNGTECNDGDVSTIGDVCHSGVCRGQDLCANIKCVTDNPCLSVGVCEPRKGTCRFDAKADGTVCGVGLMCLAGVCGTQNICGGTACYPSSQCVETGPCRAEGGCSEVPKPDGALCDDERGDTVGDQCEAGVCTGVMKCAKPCPDPEACHQAGVCNPGTGLCHFEQTPDEELCDDQDPTTQSSKCIAGNCIGSTVCNGRVCTSDGPCYLARCNSDVCEQTVKTDGAVCDDGRDETQNDRCMAGECTGDVVCAGVICGTIDACHGVGTCDPLTGRCSAPLMPDGTVCGQEQTCLKGICRSLPLSTCQGFTSDTCLLHPDPHQVLCRDCTEATCCQKCSAYNEALCPSGQLRSDHAVVSCAAGGCSPDLCCAPDKCLGCPASDDCHDPGVCDQDTGFCTDPVKIDLAPCDDGNPQTLDDVCIAGVCTGTVVCGGVICEPIGECYEPYCDNLVCKQRAKYDGATCNDMNIFTVNDVCAAGVCQGRDRCAGVVCERASQCHALGQCDPLTGLCTEPPLAGTVACDDGNFETINDQCVGGKCIGGVPCGRTLCMVQYPDCQVPACIQGVCISLIQTGECNDGDPATFDDVCVNGICRGTSLCDGVTCGPSDQCHGPARCDAKTGVCLDTTLPDGTTCDDGTGLTPNDKCNAGACLSLEVCGGVMCRPPQPMCQRAYCENDACKIEAVPDGARCNDHDENTVDDACRQGDCVGVNLCVNVICNAQDMCHSPGTCNPMTGLCRSPIVADGVRCNDGNPDTTNDRCRGGRCSGSITCDGFTPCVPAGGCRVAACVASACVQDVAADGTKCNDEMSSTVNDRCEAGMCIGDDVCEAVVCVAQDQCHEAGVCRGGTCSHPVFEDGTECNDGDPMTTFDKCIAGVCIGIDVCAGGKECLPEDVQCAAAACSEDGLTCVETQRAEGSPCDDGDVLTKDDRCTSGVCRGKNLCVDVYCQPADTCHTSVCSPTSGKCVEETAAEWARCDDGNPVTVDDTCRAGVCLGRLPCGNDFCPVNDPICGVMDCVRDKCVFTNADDGTPCNDNDPKTANDVCNGGQCFGEDLCIGIDCRPPAGSCDLSTGCDPATGTCLYASAAYGTPCSDGNTETLNDICIDGVCIGRLQCGAAFCSPSKNECEMMQCVDEVCVGTARPHGTPCDDDDPLTTRDVCKDGICVGQNLCQGVTCRSTECSDGRCDPETGLCTDVPLANGTVCTAEEDGIDAVCRSGSCVAARECGDDVCFAPADHAACRYPVCNTTNAFGGAAVSICESANRPDGTLCSDGSDATLNDACKAGVCTGLNKCEGVTCTDQPCYEPAFCNPKTGLCDKIMLVDGAACDDGDAATDDDKCYRGTCRGTSVCTEECIPAGLCFDAQCENGNTCVQRARLEGAQCDDEDPLTSEDRCRQGVCKGINRCENVACLSDSECTQDSECNPSTGSCYDYPILPDGSKCSTGVCARGICVPEVQCAGVTCPTPPEVCRIAACIAGACEVVASPNYTPCNDGNQNTLHDQCVNGICEGQDLCAASTCTAANSCRSVGTCNPATGLCSSPPKADTTPCNDNDLASADDQCIGGRCVGTLTCGGAPCVAQAQCSVAECDGNACVVRTSVDGIPCSDDDEYTFNDVCVSGVCVGTDLCENVFCPTKECKQRSTCDRRTGLCLELNLPDGTQCSDGNAATVNDKCLDGLCSGYATCGGTQCERTPMCYEITCDEGGGCNQQPQPEGAICDDQDSQTENDVCDGLGNCKGVDPCAGVTCQASNPSGCQKSGICVPSTGECVMVAEEEDKRCEVGGVEGACSGFVCMVTLVCSGVECPAHDAQCSYPACTPSCATMSLPDGTECSLGECRGGVCLSVDQCADRVCTDTECVKDARCDIASGQCTGRTLVDGTICNDADVLTQVDRCQAAECVGSVICSGTPCYAPECQYALCTANGTCGVNNKYDGTYCDSVPGGVCQNGACKVAPLCVGVVCDASNVCATSECDPGSGKCVERPLDGVPCNDGSLDTVYDTCVMGVCQKQLICRGRLCTPQNNCNTVTCNGEQCIQKHKADGTECNDDNPSTLNDRCVDGVCVGVADPLCDRVLCSPRSQCHQEGQCVAGICTQPHAKEGLQCTDGDPATPDDLCFAGQCTGVIRCGDQVCLPPGPGCSTARCENNKCISINKADGIACGAGGTCRGGKCDEPFATAPPGPTTDDCAGLGKACAAAGQECVTPAPQSPQQWQCRCLQGFQGVQNKAVATCAKPETEALGAVTVKLNSTADALQWKDKLAVLLGVSPTRLNVEVNGDEVSVGVWGTPKAGAKYSNPQGNDLLAASDLMKIFQNKVYECGTLQTEFCDNLDIKHLPIVTSANVDQCDRVVVEGLCGNGCNWNAGEKTCASAAAPADDDDAANLWAWLGPLLAVLLIGSCLAAYFASKKSAAAAAKKPVAEEEQELLSQEQVPEISPPQKAAEGDFAPPLAETPAPYPGLGEDAAWEPPVIEPVQPDPIQAPPEFVSFGQGGAPDETPLNDNRYQNPDFPGPVTASPSQLYSGQRMAIAAHPTFADAQEPEVQLVPPSAAGRGSALPTNTLSDPLVSPYALSAASGSPMRPRSVAGSRPSQIPPLFPSFGGGQAVPAPYSSQRGGPLLDRTVPSLSHAGAAASNNALPAAASASQLSPQAASEASQKAFYI